MRHTTFSDHRGNSRTLQGDSGLGWQPWDAVKDAAEFIADKAVDAGSAVYDAGSWVVDKTCSAATDPRVQGVAIASTQLPTGYTQIGAGVVMGVGGVCMVFNPSGGPTPPSAGPPLSTPSTFAPQVFSKFQKMKPSLPAGSIAAFDPKRGGYRVAVPAGLSGLGAAASFTEVGVQATPPAGATLVTLVAFEEDTGGKKPWFKNPLVIGGIGAGVLAAGVGGYFLMRR